MTPITIPHRKNPLEGRCEATSLHKVNGRKLTNWKNREETNQLWRCYASKKDSQVSIEDATHKLSHGVRNDHKKIH